MAALSRTQGASSTARSRTSWSSRTTTASACASRPCSSTRRCRSTAVGTAEAALEAIATRRFDCVVVDLGLPDLPGAELIERMRRADGGARSADRRLHRPGSRAEDDEDSARAARRDGHRQGRGLRRPAPATRPRCSCIAPIAGVPERAKQIIVQRKDDAPLDGRKVLIVDDDIRNIFALTSALEQHGMEVRLRRERPRGHRACSTRRRTSTSCWSTS